MDRLAQRLTVFLAALVVVGVGHAAPDENAPKAKPKAFGPLDVKGQLLDTDPVDQVHNQPCKLYTIKLSKGTTYVIDLQSDDFDTYLRLESNDGKQLDEDDDGGKGTNAQLVFVPEKDAPFKLVATRFAEIGTGAFRLRVRPLALPAGKKLTLGIEGTRVDARLTNDDPADPLGQGNRYKLYSVPLKAGKAYTIELNSDDFDAFLRVHDSKFRRLAQDDDGGGDLNSRIVLRPPADGVYHVVATSFDGETGAFTLRVRAGE
jgi:hypothetical protein